MKKTNKKKNPALKGLSLFANVGIAETYLDEVGVDIVVANELLEDRARFYRHLYPECNMICGDITDPRVYDRIIRESIAPRGEFIIARSEEHTLNSSH